MVANTRRVAGVVRSYDVVEQPGTQGQPGTKKLGEPARCIPGCSLLRSWPAACALLNRQTTVTGWSINKEAVAHDILRTAECRRLVAWTIWP